MVSKLMDYLAVVPAALFAGLVSINVAIILARASRHEAWAKRLQAHLDRVAWVFRMGGGSRHQH
ncbi:hypothetical protein ASF26_14695 [Methylobacterium sp. Leaf93]|nr:hypothetical protein ASF26_14695 [Methylobacterium sp. Leaf93]